MITCALYFTLLKWLSALYAGSVVVSWDANAESDLSGYRVYYGQSSHNYTHQIDAGNVTEIGISNLQTNATYYFSVTATDFSGNESNLSQEVTVFIPENEEERTNGQSQALHAYNFPNPFSPDGQQTTIHYSLEKPADVTIEIINMRNKLVRILFKNQFRRAGEHVEDHWDGRNSGGVLVSSDIYFCRISAGSQFQIIKIGVAR